MFSASHLAQLAARKRLLIAESELDRPSLALEVCRLRNCLGRAERLAGVGRMAAPALLLLLPLAGRLFGMRKGGAGGMLGTLMRGWELAGALEPLWSKICKRPP